MADDSNRTAGNDPRTTVAWYKVYLALTAVSTLLVGLTQVDVPPFDDFGPHAAAGLVVALFAAASLAYWYDVRAGRRTPDEPPDVLASFEEIPFEERAEEETDDENGTGDEGRTDEKNG